MIAEPEDKRRLLSRRALRDAALWALVAAAGLFAPIAALTAPGPGRLLSAVFPPWVETEEISRKVSDASGAVLAQGGAPGVVLVFDQAAAPGDFAARLRAAGAVFVMNGSAGSILCGAPPRAFTDKETRHDGDRA